MFTNWSSVGICFVCWLVLQKSRIPVEMAYRNENRVDKRWDLQCGIRMMWYFLSIFIPSYRLLKNDWTDYHTTPHRCIATPSGLSTKKTDPRWSDLSEFTSKGRDRDWDDIALYASLLQVNLMVYSILYDTASALPWFFVQLFLFLGKRNKFVALSRHVFILMEQENKDFLWTVYLSANQF